MTDEQNVPLTELALMVTLARIDSPEGYEAFYTLIQGFPPPLHARKWIKDIFQAKTDGRGLVIEAFRGSTKTTTLTVIFVAHQIGLHPEKSNLIVGLNDAAAKKRGASKIADIIEYNKAWKLIFPHIIKDEKRGWGDNGYWVQDTSMPYDEWSRKLGLDYTLSGWGYTSGALVGMHPTGTLVIDDIHGDENTSSPRQLEEVMDIIKGTLMPTLVPGAFHIVVGTPWVEGDAISYFKALPTMFHHIRTPLLSGEQSVWPEVFTEEEVTNRKAASGAVEFARMYMLDLEAAKGHNLKKEWLGYFNYEDIKEDWPVFMGNDYASTSDRLKQQRRDDNAICWGRLTPRGDLVLIDGDAEQMSQAEAYQRIIARASSFPTLQQIGIESIGKGEEFYELLGQAPIFMPIVPIPSHTGLARSKGGRFEKVLAPMFQRRRVLLSTRQTPFLKKFVDQWISWDGSGNSGDDTLDAVYMMTKAAEGFIALPALQVSAESPLYFEKKKMVNPWAILGRGNG